MALTTLSGYGNSPNATSGIAVAETALDMGNLSQASSGGLGLGVAWAIAVSQVSVGSTATQLAAARAGRQGVVVTQLGATPVYLGGAAVTTSTGVYLPEIAGSTKTIPYVSAIYGIVSTGTQSVSVEDYYG
jgi:hypothetical protein